MKYHLSPKIVSSKESTQNSNGGVNGGEFTEGVKISIGEVYHEARKCFSWPLGQKTVKGLNNIDNSLLSGLISCVHCKMCISLLQFGTYLAPP